MNNPDVVTLQMKWFHQDMNGNVVAELFKQIGGFFVGTSPECEIAMGTVAFFEDVHGHVHEELRTTEIDGANYDLVLYRSTTPEGARGRFIRSFYPDFQGTDQEGGGGETDEPPEMGDLYVNEVMDDSPVVISSALPNPSGTDEGQEWVTLKNVSDESVDLSDWVLRDKMYREADIDGTIEPGEERKFVTRTDETEMMLGNRGGKILLYWGDKLASAEAYPEAASGETYSFVVG